MSPKSNIGTVLIISVIILSITIVACNRSTAPEIINDIDAQNPTILTVPLDLVKSRSLSDFIAEVKYLQLEETENSLIGDINSIIFLENEIYVLDKVGQKVLVFDRNGKHLFNIDRQGNGPGEYRDLNRISYDFKRNQLLISSFTKVLWFNHEGEFVREISSPYAGSISMRVIDDLHLGFYMAYSNLGRAKELANLNILDYDGKLIKRSLPFSRRIVHGNIIGLSNYFSQTPNNIILSETYSRDVLEIMGSSLRVKYRFDFGDNNLPKDFVDDVLTDKSLNYSKVFKKSQENKWARFWGSGPIENSRFLYFPLAYTDQVQYFVYDKISNKYLRYDETVKNTIGGLEHLYHFAVDGDYFISKTYASELKESVESGMVHDPNLIEQIQRLELNQNPILRFVKIKEL